MLHHSTRRLIKPLRARRRSMRKDSRERDRRQGDAAVHNRGVVGEEKTDQARISERSWRLPPSLFYFVALIASAFH
jgi:hypothetical protein